ncbi:MAG: STAS domain-containing protein [Clostridia bacterium]|jgi:anti-sigma B factor antagonist|nr:STAS domain-containing protein [Clostridia bacterium]MBQ4448029.1 STAS domain-containing protein [Clostridia bacterium]
MNIHRTVNNDELTLSIEGRLDTLTAPELEKTIDNDLGGIEKLVLDLEKLDYISSAGLRVLLHAEKIMQRLGGMRVKNVSETVMEIFAVTGFDEILTIE